MLQPFGKYLLDEEIARGGMARVYLARLRGVGGFEKRLVVKQVRPELARDPRFVAMFVEEAKTLVQMSHPNVVPVYELGVVDGVYFLAMEHVDGATLDEVLRDGPLAPPLVAAIGAQIGDALAYAHERFGLVHRDVTPRNVILDASGHVRLLDFGIAAPAEGAATGEVFGSHGYMSPEQARGATLDARSDLFSLGIVLYEAATGDRAFLRDKISETQTALLEGPYPRLTGRGAVPDVLAYMIDELLAREPDARPKSAADVARRMRGFLASARPEGVAHELGARAEAARERSSRDRVRGEVEQPSERSDPSGVVRSIATSAVLEAMLEGTVPAGTKPIARRSVEPPGREEPPEIADPDADTEPETAASGTVPIARPSRAPIAADPVESRPATAPSAAGAGAGSRIALVASVLFVAATAAAFVLMRTPDESAREDEPRTIEAPPEPAKRTMIDPTRTETERTPETPPDQHATNTETDPAPEQPTAPAHLSVNATPWAEVRIDGRAVGTTPQRRLAVPPGSHTIELECPPLGRTARATFRATSGAQLRAIGDLTRDPPTLVVR